jgi:hypothetical protein
MNDADIDLMGAIGQANSMMVPGHKGEVLLECEGGGFAAYLAYPDKPIAKGSRVRVIDVLPGRTLGVTADIHLQRVEPAPEPPKAPPPGSNLMNPETKGMP